MASHHCPHAELLEKLCGRTAQKYFQLLGNTDDGLPEFVLADIDALISPRQAPAVAHILSQMQDRSQSHATTLGSDLNGAGAGIGQQHALPLGHDTSPAQTGKEASIGKKPTSAGTAASSYGSSKGPDSSWEDPPPGFAPLSSRGSPEADKPAQPVPAPSSHASGSDAGSSQAMQALLSACKQLPPANNKDLRSAEVKLAAPPALPTKAPASNAVSKSAATGADAASTLLPSQLLSQVPLGAAKAETSNGIVKGVHDKMIGASRSSSSASGMTDAMQARSAASTELSGSSTVSVSTALATQKESLQEPFCIDCIAQPDKCPRHPLQSPPTSASPHGGAVEQTSLEAAAGSSECSSQVCFCSTEGSALKQSLQVYTICPLPLILGLALNRGTCPSQRVFCLTVFAACHHAAACTLSCKGSDLHWSAIDHKKPLLSRFWLPVLKLGAVFSDPSYCSRPHCACCHAQFT